MRIKQICMMVLLSLGIAPWAKAQTFDKLWKQVEQAEQKSLPQTVIQLTDRIYKKAETERNSPQMLKAYEIPRNVDSR
jgi:F420-dependent methylenetetrahydromethanopterin dehydrogenase